MGKHDATLDREMVHVFPGSKIVTATTVPGYPELGYETVAGWWPTDWCQSPAVTLHKPRHGNANERIAAGESTVVTFVKGYGTHDNFAWIDWRETVRTVRIPVPVVNH